MTDPSLIYPAATVVLLRERASNPEVLMLRRSRNVSLAKGLWVFPGGRIDQEDYRGDLEDVESAARYAAVRETLEETQLVIEATDLLCFSHWTTPPGQPKRFATWFFIAPVAPTVTLRDIIVDGGEILEARWCHPAEALADYRSGCVDMLPPTLATLHELAGCESVEQAMSRCGELGQAAEPRQFALRPDGLELLNPRKASMPPQDVETYLLAEPWRRS